MHAQWLEVRLPGGLADNGRIEHRVRFHTLTGRIEQSLIEAAMNRDRPTYVTEVLSQALERIGELPADPANVSRLCVADRQYLMLRLAALLNGEQLWLKVDCGNCHSLFDVELRRCDLPVKKAGEGYPKIRLQVNKWEIEAGVPTGRDQEGIGDLTEAEAVLWLLQQCIYSVNGRPPREDFFRQLKKQHIAAIDKALDDVSPAVCDRLVVTCPECSQKQHARLDHYADSGLDEHLFYDEIHTLASHYHWSEADILDLPRLKRRRYLEMISRFAGNDVKG